MARIRPCSARMTSSLRMATERERYPTGRPSVRDRPLRRPLPDRPHLDREANPQQRVAGGDRDRLVEVFDLHEAVAAQLLLGLGEGAVRHDRLAVLDPHGDGDAGRVQRIAALVDAAVPEVLAELDGLLEDRAPILRGPLFLPRLVLVDEQHVPHVGGLLSALLERGCPNRLDHDAWPSLMAEYVSWWRTHPQS